jgi:hypothetical protein
MSKRSGAYQQMYAVDYAMQPTEVHPTTNAVISRVSLFCKFFGREPAKVERKRKVANNLHFYTPPFRTGMILKHLDGQHPEKWAEYNESTLATKMFDKLGFRRHNR